MKTSKEKILVSALNLFSVKGYNSVSLRDLAASVGIKSASIYNHFKSKDDILETILCEAKKRYFDKRKTINVPDNEDNEAAVKYNHMSREEFLGICEELFFFYVKDPFMSNLRKFLCIEQFADSKIGHLYKQYFFDDIINSQAEAFENFMKAGKFKQANPKIVALHFYAPIFVCFTLYDNGMSEDTALGIVKEHALQFSKNYDLEYSEEVGF